MKASRWMALSLILGLSTLAVACDTSRETEVDEQLETDPMGAEPLENEEEEGGEGEGAEGDD